MIWSRQTQLKNINICIIHGDALSVYLCLIFQSGFLRKIYYIKKIKTSINVIQRYRHNLWLFKCEPLHRGLTLEKQYNLEFFKTTNKHGINCYFCDIAIKQLTWYKIVSMIVGPLKLKQKLKLKKKWVFTF